MGNDGLEGSRGNDTIFGGAGEDFISGGDGADAFDGGADFDQLSVQNSYYVHGFQGATFNANTGILIDPWGNTDTFTGFEAYRGSQFGDTFIGSGASEQFGGLGGRDTINGGGGVDVVRYDRDINFGGNLGVTVNLTTGVAIDGFGRQDTLSNIENIRATNFNDTLTGNAVANQIRAFDGNNSINGGAGADDMRGGGGNDTYTIDNAGDIINEIGDGGNGVDTVISSITATLVENGTTRQGQIENLTLTGAAALNGTGNGLDNFITGNTGNNVLNGLFGNDVLNGGAGNDTLNGSVGDDIMIGGTGVDTMVGQAGNDTYYVDVAGDIVDENAASGTDTVVSTISYNLTANGTTVIGGIERLTLAGATNINATGNALNNTMVGNSGNNVMNGGLGLDTLLGGGGLDTFVFNTALGATNVDTINSFVVADDTIQLENAIFAGLAAGALAATAFKNTAGGAVDADDRIIYNSATGALTYDADGSGAGAAVKFATLGAGLGVTNADFFVI